MAGEAVGFAALFLRSDIGFLSDLFVDPRHQSLGIGRRLLDRLLSGGARCYCALSSSDPRALSLYVRAGMRPRWPHYQLTATVDGLRGTSPSGVSILAAAPNDGEILEWDGRIGGRERPEDHAFWRAAFGATPVWVRRRGTTIGYAYVRIGRSAADTHPSVMLGPIGADSPPDAADCVAALVMWAREQGEAVKVAIPGPHPALPHLLAAGFRIRYAETFVSSCSHPFCDPTTYAPGAGLEGSTFF